MTPVIRPARLDDLLAVAVAVLVINEWSGGSVIAWS